LNLSLVVFLFDCCFFPVYSGDARGDAGEDARIFAKTSPMCQGKIRFFFLRKRNRVNVPPAHFGFALPDSLRLDGSRLSLSLLTMRFSLALLSGLAIFGALPAGADDVLPPRLSFDRYSAMVKNSPFAIATALALPAATPDFAKDFYVANAAHSPDGDLVTIASSSDQNFKKYLSTKEPVDGYSIAKIEWSEDVGKTKVTISKDGQFATLTFNQALLTQQGPANARSALGQGRQAVPLVPPSAPRQASNARSRGVIQHSKPAPVPPPNPIPAATPDVAPLEPQPAAGTVTVPGAAGELSLPPSNIVPDIAPPTQDRMKQPGEPD
jgi:hypothetical protein